MGGHRGVKITMPRKHLTRPSEDEYESQMDLGGQNASLEQPVGRNSTPARDVLQLTRDMQLSVNDGRNCFRT